MMIIMLYDSYGDSTRNIVKKVLYVIRLADSPYYDLISNKRYMLQYYELSIAYVW